MTRTKVSVNLHKRLICSMLWFLFSFACYAIDDNSRVAFYYGTNPPLDELHAFNIVVVTPQKDLDPKKYNNLSSQLYAYVNVGEVDANSPDLKQIKPSWFKGKNADWGSHIMDMANPAWRDYLLNKKISSLWEQGYQGFFLDTLDSYQLLKLTPTQIKEQQAGIVDLIKKIKIKYPGATIITNRGFEVLDSIHQEINAMAAESLFAKWNPAAKKYEQVSDSDRKWLLNVLNKTHQEYHLPVIVIDYVPPGKPEEARQVAKQIRTLGFIPWVADADLNTIGVSTIEIVPRKILLLYNLTSEKINVRSTDIAAFDYTAFLFQFKGFVPVLQPVDTTLPQQVVKGKYAGIVAWFNERVVKHHDLLESWLSKQIQAGVPVVFMQNFGLPSTSPLLKQLNINIDKNKQIITSVKTKYKEKSIGFEVLPQPLTTDFLAATIKNAKVLLKLTNGEQDEDAIAIAPWGGYVLAPFDMVVLPNTQARWVINPFSFFSEALRLPQFPIPDITTATGRRIMTVHIDGDAFVSRVPWIDNKYAGEVILEQILNIYKIPTTVSIIQREFVLLEANAGLSKRLTETAQKIFRLPWVQIATHTYSHPLVWGGLVEGKPNMSALSYPDKNYLFNYKTEVAGSTEFINSKLAPSDKKVVAVFWSGDCNLQQGPLDVAAEVGIKNINGMAKIYLNASKSLNNLGAFGIMVGNYFQVFAPIPNEFEYTDDWSQPLYAFQNVIHTFQLTDKPVRYKPMSIYYHFYSAADQAAFRALKRVYKWALKQYITPLYIADYISKVLDFNQIIIAKDLNGEPNTWYILNNNSLREFRLPISQGFPDIEKSRNVAGYSPINSDNYIHVGSQADTFIKLTTTESRHPFLIDANAELTRWDILDMRRINFSLMGHVPLSFKLANMENCQVELNHKPLKAVDVNSYLIQEANSGTFEIHCNRSKTQETR
ncbi:extracellular protein [Legionella massiliensis]|uniref:Extracellular protein n=1 Tax=Legionella massiliensis TaxID=1034943 RepID=A0A078KYR4_9GAMM|nr:endo alpha-1,4 polygalactosaminidase [Legionella massiliensis]CDZ78066.1 extracellular protein [Legionella massiliensis]CEE13804.1 hypothetical protein BN1094_02363 [Legionella massiliensis]